MTTKYEELAEKVAKLHKQAIAIRNITTSVEGLLTLSRGGYQIRLGNDLVRQDIEDILNAEADRLKLEAAPLMAKMQAIETLLSD